MNTNNVLLLNKNSFRDKKEMYINSVSKKWVLCDTISSSKSCAIAYSVNYTTRANAFKVCEYFRHLLTEIIYLLEDTGTDFMYVLLP